jgi:hypothetical protein
MTINKHGFNNLFKKFIKQRYPNNPRKQKFFLNLPFLKKQQLLFNYHQENKLNKQIQHKKQINIYQIDKSIKKIDWSKISHIWKKYLKNDFELHDCGGAGDCFFLCLAKAMCLKSKTIRTKLANTIDENTIERLKLFYKGDKDGCSEFIDGLNICETNKKLEFTQYLLNKENSIEIFKKIISSTKPIILDYKKNKIHISYWGDEWSINKCMEIFPKLRLFIIDTGVKTMPSFAWTDTNFENKDKNILLFRIPGHYQILYNKSLKNYILKNNQIPDYIQTLYLEQFTK